MFILFIEFIFNSIDQGVYLEIGANYTFNTLKITIEFFVHFYQYR